MFFTPPATPGLAWIERLPDGHQGTWRTLEAMRWLCRKDYQSAFVRAVVADIVSAGRDVRSPAECLFFFARDAIKYVNDPPGIEQISSFERTTQSRQGDCDDKCVWLATALLCVGIPCRFICQSYRGDTWDHVYLGCWDATHWRWTSLDPTADGHTGIKGNFGWRQPLPWGGAEMFLDV